MTARGLLEKVFLLVKPHGNISYITGLNNEEYEGDNDAIPQGEYL